MAGGSLISRCHRANPLAAFTNAPILSFLLAAPPDIRRITLPAGSTSFSALLGIVADRIGFSVSDVLTYVDEKGDEITVIIIKKAV